MDQAIETSDTNRLFTDRQEAADALASRLSDYRGGDTIVLGIPRGGVVVADRIAWHLDADMNVALCQKIYADQSPNLVIGAITEDGRVFLPQDIVSWLEPYPELMKEEILHQVDFMHAKRNQYRSILPQSPLMNRTVIVTDDGLSTGVTLQAVLGMVRANRPKRLIAAFPMGPANIVSQLSGVVDTGKLSLLEELESEIPGEISHMMQIPGLGAKRIAILYRSLEITTLDELEQAARDGRIKELEGFGKKPKRTSWTR